MEQGKRSLINAINDEREHLSQIRSIANFVIDTTKLSPKELKERIRRYYEDEEFETLQLMSQVSVLNMEFRWMQI